MKCFYCQSDNMDESLVCGCCARDIAVPAALIAERDELARKRDNLLEELRRVRREVEMARSGRTLR